MRTELKTDLQRAIKEYKRNNCPRINQRKEVLKRFVESKNLSVNATGINKPRKTKSKPAPSRTSQPRTSQPRRSQPAPNRTVSSRYNTTNLVESRINLQNLPNRGNISM